jgi:hypothetical protein
MKSIEHEIVVNSTFAAGAMNQTLPEARMAVERLPFTVRAVRSEEALHKAVTIRRAAYTHHMPALAAIMDSPEPCDRDQGSVVLLAESRMDGSPVGTMRIQTNRFRDLAIARSVELPAWLRNKSMAEATRLAVASGSSGRVVKIVLCKAFYLYCLAANIEWMVIAARPPLDRQYEAALFKDIYPGKSFPMRHGKNIPHRVLAFDVRNAEAKWDEAGHSLLAFMCHTRHPDIDLGDADVSPWRHAAPQAELSDRVAVGA